MKWGELLFVMSNEFVHQADQQARYTIQKELMLRDRELFTWLFEMQLMGGEIG